MTSSPTSATSIWADESDGPDARCGSNLTVVYFQQDAPIELEDVHVFELALGPPHHQ